MTQLQACLAGRHRVEAQGVGDGTCSFIMQHALCIMKM